MSSLVNFPFLLLAVSLVTLWLSAQMGNFFRKRVRTLNEDEQEYFSVVLTASLTLMALIIGFSFSMAINRYDQRKNYEERKLTPSEQNMFGPIFCLLLMRQECVICWESILISVYRSTRPATAQLTATSGLSY